MIVWKTIRYEQLEMLREMKLQIAKKELKDRDAVVFMLSLVVNWDFQDADTGEPLAPDAPETVNLLSIPQYKELCDTFNEQVGSKVIVPKNERLAVLLWADSIKSQKAELSEPPGWVGVILLARKLNKLPSEILHEDALWVARLEEVLYHFNRQGIEF